MCVWVRYVWSDSDSSGTSIERDRSRSPRVSRSRHEDDRSRSPLRRSRDSSPRRRRSETSGSMETPSEADLQTQDAKIPVANPATWVKRIPSVLGNCSPLASRPKGPKNTEKISKLVSTISHSTWSVQSWTILWPADWKESIQQPRQQPKRRKNRWSINIKSCWMWIGQLLKHEASWRSRIQ